MPTDSHTNNRGCSSHPSLTSKQGLPQRILKVLLSTSVFSKNNAKTETRNKTTVHIPNSRKDCRNKKVIHPGNKGCKRNSAGIKCFNPSPNPSGSIDYLSRLLPIRSLYAMDRYGRFVPPKTGVSTLSAPPASADNYKR